MDNIKMYLGEIGWVDVEWIGVAEERDKRTFVNAVMNFRIP
jgi:hypothetical protein